MISYHNLKKNKNINNPSINNLYPNGKNYSQFLMKNGASYYLIENNNNKDVDKFDKCKIAYKKALKLMKERKGTKEF